MTDDVDSLMYSGARGRYAFPTTAAEWDARREEETPRSSSRMEIKCGRPGENCSIRGCVIAHKRAPATRDLLTGPCPFVRLRGVVVAFD